MKKLILKLTYVTALFAFMQSCDDVERVYYNDAAETVLSLSDNNLTLSEDNGTNEILTLTWSDPDYGFDAAALYSVQMDVQGGDFSNPQIISVGSSLEKTFTVEELNSKLLSLSMTPAEEGVAIIRIKATLSEYQEIFSNTVNLNVTPYSSLLDLSTNLGVVGSATPGGWGNENIPDLQFYTTSMTDVYVAYVSLRDGEIKFRNNNDWAENWGDDGNDGTLDSYGANIPVSAGTYKIEVNFSSMTYTMEAYSWGLVGSATPNQWNGPDLMLHYNSYQDDWRAVVTLGEGEVKFRFNNDWGLNYGDDGADGSMEANGANISVSSGHYLVSMNLNTQSYTMEEIDVWGLVGSATANGWDGPNDKFMPDFGIMEGYYYLSGAELVDGEIKVRQNDAWGLNYGDDGNDGLMEVDGANIPVSAGTYNIILNMAANPPTIEMYQW
ncbi:MAG: SusE domain-containing protein [Flavobacteriaceae bacterium]|nr:SusE domain-containing protein [Flavobacteriaceae bacterium]